MATHELKTWPEFFEAVSYRKKTFEVRKNDRDYKVDDNLILKCFEPWTNKYTGEVCRRRVTYVMHGGKFGIDPEYVVLGLD